MRSHTDSLRKHAVQPGNVFVAPQQPKHSTEHGLWVCDSSGTIVSCSSGAARLFDGNIADLEGRTIWSLILNVAADSTPPSYRARHMAYLARDGVWHRFFARDVAGWQFPIELSVTTIGLNESTGFLVHLRRVAVETVAHQSMCEIGSNHG